MTGFSSNIDRSDIVRRFRDPRLDSRILEIPARVEAEPIIWLTLLPTMGGEAQADGSLTKPGIHLRWAFESELGFPGFGFTVQRRLYAFDEFNHARPLDWHDLPHGALPNPLFSDRNTLRSRMSAGAPAHIEQHIDAHLESLVQLLEQIKDLSALGSAPIHGSGVRTDLRPFEMLLLGALDPVLARGLGLYLIDGSIRAGVPADYRVIGKWGPMRWPQRSVFFDQLASNRSLAASGLIRLDWLTLFTSCSCVVDATDIDGAFLRITGTPGANLRLITAFAIGELELEIAPTGSASNWQVEGAARNGAEVAVGFERRGNSLFVNPTTTAQRFDEVTLIPTGADQLPRALHIVGVHVRRALGIVGERKSPVARATPPEDSVFEEDGVSFPLASSARTPPMATIRPETVPPNLSSEDGTVVVDLSKADIVCRHQPKTESGSDHQRTVRLDVGVQALDGSAPEVHLTGSSLPSEREISIARWPLEKLSSFNAPLLTGQGEHAFTENQSRLLDWNFPRPVLELYTGSSRTNPNARLSEPGYLKVSLSALPSLDANLDDIRIGIWAAPVEGPELYYTLVGSSHKNSLWLGLRQEPNGYRPRCWINGEGPYEAETVIPARSWSHLGLEYDGASISFFINGIRAGIAQAVLGPLNRNPRGTLCIGDDPQRESTIDFPFSGFLADLQISHYTRASATAIANSGPLAPVPLIDKTRSRRSFEVPSLEARGFADHPRYKGLRAAWSMDGQAFDVVGQQEDSERGRLRYIAGHPLDAQRRVLRLNGIHVVEVLDRAPEFYSFDDKLFVAARVFPGPIRPPSIDPRDRSHLIRPTMTILSADKETCFAFGLQAHGLGQAAGYRLTLFLAGAEYTSTSMIRPGSWSRVAAAYDGASVRFFVDGQPEPDRPEGIQAASEVICTAPSQIIRIGGEVDPDELQVKSAFVGQLADVEIWDRLPRHGEELPSANGLEPAADFVAHDLDDGRHRFWVRGVDLFGRLGPKSYAETLLDSFREPPAPTTVRAGFVPVRAQVSAIALPSDPDARTRISLPRNALGMLPAPRVVGYDLELTRSGPINPITDLPSQHTESLEILTAEAAGEMLEVSVRRSAFSLLDANADLDRPVEIPVDHHVQVEWTWTGAQRLFAPEVFAFHIVQRRRDSQTWSATIGEGEFALVDDVIEPDAAAASLRADPITHDEWQMLAGNDSDQRGLRWLPEPTAGPEGTMVYKLRLPATSALPDSPHRLPLKQAKPETFVPGVLVAYDETAQPPGWQVLQVHWHEWTAARGWSLLLTRKRSAEEARIPERTDAALLLRGVRFYPGQRYRARTSIDTGILREPTVAYEVCVRSVSRRETRTLESEIGSAVSLVAVDRRRPPRPPIPRVSIERANVHGRSRAIVEWDASPSGDRPTPTYLVYRAVDSAVHARDVELRRSRAGYYHSLSPEQIVADDRDFTGWIAESFPDFANGWPSRLFVPKPESFERPGQDAEWRRAKERYAEASAVWRAWSTRFHAGLTLEPSAAGERSQLQELADRTGMEAAFSLVAPSAVPVGPYEDDVNGNLRNAYLYRLRTQSPALVPSAEWGGVSSAAFAPKTRPPHAPSFTEMEAADRQVTLHFALSDEFDLAEYRIFRSVDRASVEDVRWWEESPPERVSFRISDPLLRARGNALALSLELAAAEIIAVYRLADVAVEGASSPPDPYNLFRTTRALGAPSRFDPSTGRIEGLSPVRNGLPVAVVFRDSAGAEREVRMLAPAVLVDTGLLGLTDYYYQISSVDRFGNVSIPGPALHARPLSIAPPTPPPLAVIRSAGQVELQWETEWEALVQRCEGERGSWVALSRWLSAGRHVLRDSEAAPDRTWRYRLWVRNAADQKVKGDAVTLEGP